MFKKLKSKRARIKEIKRKANTNNVDLVQEKSKTIHKLHLERDLTNILEEISTSEDLVLSCIIEHKSEDQKFVKDYLSRYCDKISIIGENEIQIFFRSV